MSNPFEVNFKIMATSLLISVCYLTIGLQLAVVPPL
jgi:hypothetical protein